MYKRALIITGGDVDESYHVEVDGTLLIAVDGGLRAADRMSLVPHVIIGDFDTVQSDLLKKYETNPQVKILQLNPEKDDTDTEAAVRYAMEQEITEIDLLGGTGNRFDHTYANMFLLKMAYEQGVRITMYTGLSKIYLICGEKIYKKDQFFGKYISFLQFDGPALGVTLEGFKYPLKEFDFDTRKTYRLGVSNESLGEDAKVTIREGYLLVVESLEDK